MWLYLSVDHRHFGYTTKLSQKQKKKKKNAPGVCFVGGGGGGGVARVFRRTRRTHSSAAASDGRLSHAGRKRLSDGPAGVCLADGRLRTD